MSFQLRRTGQDRLIELGGGNNPAVHPTCMGGRDVNVDVRQATTSQGQQCVDFIFDFDEYPWPISSDEFDGAVSIFCLEHVSWRNTHKFLAETFRIIKPGAKAFFIVPNTEAQMRYILNKPEFDGDEGSMLYGDQTYKDNTHKAAFSPKTITKFFQEAGFSNILVTPYGEPLHTDMAIEAIKPTTSELPKVILQQPLQEAQSLMTQAQIMSPPPSPRLPPEELFDREYFNGGKKHGGYAPFYWDYPHHEVIFRHVMARRPKSVLELGCGRGFITKRLQDAGIPTLGFDVSQYCYLNRAAEFQVHNLLNTPWPTQEKKDFCLSLDFLDRVPEDCLSAVLAEINRLSTRGLHALDFNPNPSDKTRCLIKPIEWWKGILPSNHEIVPLQELMQGDLPPEVLKGDGLTKLALGTYMSMTHFGWVNTDVHDLSQFAQQHRFNFKQFDLRQGIPYNTGSVDLIHLCHVLEHFSYGEGLTLLRECRRVIKPDGVIRIIVPDGEMLTALYHYGQNVKRGVDVGEIAGPTSLGHFDQLSEGCANAATPVGKLYALLLDNHKAVYDCETLCGALHEAGWIAKPSSFRKTDCGERGEQILRETIDMCTSLSLTVEGMPLVG